MEVDREIEDKLESRWWFLTRVGRKGRSSAERKPDESSDSSSSSWNVGVVRYVVESARVPIGWGTGGKVCVWNWIGTEEVSVDR